MFSQLAEIDFKTNRLGQLKYHKTAKERERELKQFNIYDKHPSIILQEKINQNEEIIFFSPPQKYVELEPILTSTQQQQQQLQKKEQPKIESNVPKVSIQPKPNVSRAQTFLNNKLSQLNINPPETKNITLKPIQSQTIPQSINTSQYVSTQPNLNISSRIPNSEELPNRFEVPSDSDSDIDEESSSPNISVNAPIAIEKLNFDEPEDAEVSLKEMENKRQSEVKAKFLARSQMFSRKFEEISVDANRNRKQFIEKFESDSLQFQKKEAEKDRLREEAMSQKFKKN